MGPRKTKWPRSPDPTPGHFAARGFANSVAAHWHYRIWCPTATGWPYDLVGGITVRPSSADAGFVVWLTTKFPGPYPAWSLKITMQNRPLAYPFNWTIKYAINFSASAVFQYENNIEATWPNGPFLPLPITLPEIAFPFTPRFNGPCFCKPMPWDSPPGPDNDPGWS